MPDEPDRSEVTRILDALERGEDRPARDLLPLVYDELRRLAASRLVQERIVPLYEAWGKPEKAEEWRRKLGAAGPPPVPPGR